MKRRQARGGERAEAPQSGQNQKHGLGGPGNPGFKSAGHELSPIYMIKNMVRDSAKLEQERQGQRHVES